MVCANPPLCIVKYTISIISALPQGIALVWANDVEMLSKLRSFQIGVSLETLAQQGECRDVMMDGGSYFRVECSPTGRHRDGFNVERIELENAIYCCHKGSGNLGATRADRLRGLGFRVESSTGVGFRVQSFTCSGCIGLSPVYPSAHDGVKCTPVSKARVDITHPA